MAGKADGDAKVLAAKADEDATILAAKSGEDATVMAANADEDEKTDDYLNKMAAKGDEKAKIVNDPVYGTIHLDLLAVKIIDTPCFQRLRYIKQLAFADFVYPGATHTRFAHSIGVYHLACQMIKEIESHPFPKGAVQMSPEDKRCIRVAALCHDLGHGPFSHLYEQIGASVLGEDIGKKLKHEQISQFLVGKMFEECSLKDYLGPKPDEHIQLIKDLIERNGDLPESENGRKYMFQIVSNKESGVDVDKWDYFNRDAIACGVPERFQYDRALSVARVVETKPGMFELGYRDYDAFSMYNMFNTRFTLYRKVYKHKVVQAVDLMITDVCKLVCHANETNNEDQSTNIDLYPITSQPDVKRLKSFIELDRRNYLDVDKFLMLRDDVLLKIGDNSGKYKEASHLMQRLHTRKLYKLFHDRCVKIHKCECEKEEEEEAPQCECAKKKAEEIKKRIEESLINEEEDMSELVEVVLLPFNYGSKQKNPVRKLYFYSKTNYEKGFQHNKDEVSLVLPNVFQEYHVRVYERFSGNKKYESEEVETYRKTLEGIVESVKNSCDKESSPSKKQKVDCK